jgi:pyruvate/2-oxoglutarate dehydrogenase complex dihydrolipoamide dehydrogenase (E3) component
MESLGVAFDPRGNVAADEMSYKTSIPKVFACGDMRARPIPHRLGDPREPPSRARRR